MNIFSREEKHPVIEILERISKQRQNNDSPSTVVYDQLPVLNQEALSHIETQLQASTRLKNIKIEIKFVFWNKSLTEALVSHLINKRWEYTDAFLFETFLFIVSSETKNNEEILFLFLKGFRGVIEYIELFNLICYFFEELVEKCYDLPKFTWDVQNVNLICEIFSQYNIISLRMKAILDKLFLQLILQNNMEACTLIIIFLTFAISRNHYHILLTDNIIENIDPLLNSYNRHVVEFLCRASSINMKFRKDNSTLENKLMILPTIIISSFQMVPIIMKKEYFVSETNVVPSLIQMDNLNIDKFIDFDQSQFENEFKAVAIENVLDFSQLMNEEQILLFNSVNDALFLANDQIVNSIFTRFLKIVTVDSSIPHYYDYLTCILYLLNESKSQSFINTFLPMLNQEDFLSPTVTIFHKFNPYVNTVRRHLIKLAMKTNPKLVSQYLDYSFKYPLLFVEILTRIHSDGLDLSLILDHNMIKSITVILKNLIINILENESDLIKSALPAMLSVVFSLLNKKETLIMFAHSSYFLRDFLSFLFINILRGPAISVIQACLFGECSFTTLKIISSGINKIISNTKDDAIIVQVLEGLIEACSHNIESTKYFIFNFNTMMKAMSKNPTIGLVDAALKYMHILSQESPNFKLTSTNFQILVNSIKKAYSSDPPEKVLNSLLNMIACSNSITNDTIFSIQRNQFLSLIIAVFGESQQLIVIIKRLLKLCEISVYNCVACHDGEVDLILLDYIYNFLILDKNEVEYRGTSFKLIISKDELKNYIMRFLILVGTQKSNNEIALKIIKLLFQVENSVCMKLVSCLDTHLFSSDLKPTFPLGKLKKSIEIKDISSETFNKMFSISFWLKIDLPLAYHFQEPTRIITLSDNESEVALVFHRESIYFQSNSHGEKSSIQSHTNIPSNQWILISMISQRTVNETTAIGIYVECQLPFCREFPIIYFDGRVSFSVGGYGLEEGESPGVVGPFGISDRILQDQFLIELGHIGQTGFNNKEGGFFISTNQDLDPCNVNYMNYQPKNLENIINENNHLLTLLPLFSMIDKLPEGFIEIIVSIMKQFFQIYQPHYKYFGIISTFIFKNQPQAFNYSLYLALFSLYEVIQDIKVAKNLFDNIIINIHIWGQTPPSIFNRIIYHWGHNAMNVCQGSFNRENVFCELLKKFEHFFDNVKDKFNEEEQNVALKNFTHLLIEARNICVFQRKDIDFFFILSCKASEEKLKFYLPILENYAQEIKSFLDNLIGDFQFFVAKEQPETIILALQLLHKLSFPKLMKNMTASSIQLMVLEQKEMIYHELVNRIEEYPGFMFICCILALDLSFELQISTALAMSSLIERQVDLSIFLNDEFWFLWPLLLALKMNNEASIAILDFISQLIRKSENYLDLLDTIIDIIQVLNMTPETIQRIFLLIDINIDRSPEVFDRGFRLVLYHFTNKSFYQSHLLEMMKRSSYGINVDKTNGPVYISNIFELDAFINRNFSNYQFILALSSNGNRKLVDSGDIVKIYENSPNPIHQQLLHHVLTRNKSYDLEEFDRVRQENELVYYQHMKSTLLQIRKVINDVKITATLNTNIFDKYKKSNLDSLLKHKRINEKTLDIFFYHINALQPSDEKILSIDSCFAKTQSKLEIYPMKNPLLDDLKKRISMKKRKASNTAQLLLKDKKIEVSFLLDHDGKYFHVYSQGLLDLKINVTDIDYLFPSVINGAETSLDIRTKNLALLLDFCPLQARTIIPLFPPTDQENLIPVEIKASLSNFAYLMSCNMIWGSKEIHGKSYEEFCAPEICKKPFEEIYQNRKELENSKIPGRLHKPKHIPIDEIVAVMEDPFVEYVGFSDIDLFYAVYLRDNQWFISFNGRETLKINEYQILKPKKVVAFKQGALVFTDEVLQICSVVAPLDQSFNFKECDFVVTFEDDFLFVSNECNVMKYSVSDFELEKLTVSKSKICCIAVSISFHALAYGAIDRKVYVHSLNSGKVTTIIETENEPRNLIITEAFGLIIVDLGYSIQVYTINGTKIRELLIKYLIFNMNSTTDENGFDFVIFHDEFNQIGVFEAGNPQNIKYLQLSQEIEIHNVSYDYIHEVLIVAFRTTHDKENVRFIPFKAIIL